MVMTGVNRAPLPASSLPWRSTSSICLVASHLPNVFPYPVNSASGNNISADRVASAKLLHISCYVDVRELPLIVRASQVNFNLPHLHCYFKW